MQSAARQCLWKDTIVWPGTVLAVEASAECMSVLIAWGELAEGSSSVTVIWGDGSKNEYSQIINATHTYVKRGEYTILISDDLCSFGFTNSSGAMPQRNMLRELISLGSKVTAIADYGFNNCKKMRGVINLPNVTNIGSYAFGTTLGITDYILPSMTMLRQISFYSCSSPRQIHADNVTAIEWLFWEYYGWHLYDLYLRNSTCAEIKAMSGFPFSADKVEDEVRFHASDGIVLKNGAIISN